MNSSITAPINHDPPAFSKFPAYCRRCVVLWCGQRLHDRRHHLYGVKQGLTQKKNTLPSSRTGGFINLVVPLQRGEVPLPLYFGDRVIRNKEWSGAGCNEKLMVTIQVDEDASRIGNHGCNWKAFGQLLQKFLPSGMK